MVGQLYHLVAPGLTRYNMISAGEEFYRTALSQFVFLLGDFFFKTLNIWIFNISQ